MNITDFSRWAFSVLGALLALIQPTLPYIAICTLAIFYDCFSAWMLAKRVRKVYPERTTEHAAKFNSHHFGKVVLTLVKSWGLIFFAYLVQRYITESWPVDLTKIAAGAICFWQLWSILENESSCNDAKWAKVAQKIFVDKVSRHFDIDLSDLKEQ